MIYDPVQFINESITPCYESQPILEKKSGCPDSFIWREEEYRIVEIISEWHDYKRRGRMTRNMKPTRATSAERKGSWGVGVDYYRVRTDNSHIYDLYYDRAPKNADQRKGQWFIYRELKLSESGIRENKPNHS